MKKYVKPELFYEHFELSQHIANCVWEMTSASEETCTAVGEEGSYLDFTLFTNAAGCDAGPDIGLGYEDYCQHQSGSGLSVFAS